MGVMLVFRKLRFKSTITRTIYNCFSSKSDTVVHQTGNDLKRQRWTEDATLYIHWPYCEKRCSYCNFNKYISKNVDQKLMKKCLVAETNHLLGVSEVKKIKSVYFGGGTPSLAEPDTVKAILDTVKERVELQKQTNSGLNFTFCFRDAGVNRVSLGLQALNEEDLKLFGRNHSVEDGLRSLEVCKDLFPKKTSVDVIFGRPQQTVEIWDHELEQVLKLADNHVSLYQLTLERGTALFKMVMDRKVLMPSPDEMADLYELTVQKLEEYGFHRYEASNFAKTQKAESSHNKAYWDGSQYIGVGPGAHGRFIPFGDNKTVREARVQTLEPIPWMYEVENYGHATRKAVSQSQEQMLQELLMLGLRTRVGITEQRWSEFCGDVTLLDLFDDTYIVRMLKTEGYLETDDGAIRTTPRGMNVVDSIVPELIDILNNYFKLQS